MSIGKRRIRYAVHTSNAKITEYIIKRLLREKERKRGASEITGRIISLDTITLHIFLYINFNFYTKLNDCEKDVNVRISSHGRRFCGAQATFFISISLEAHA